MDLEDVSDWLDTFDRVSRHNFWDATTKFNNVVFYLTGVAKTWFLNHEADLLNWETFTTRFRDLFGRPAQRAAEAHQKLAFRVQQPDESYTSYIEDVVALCNRTDPRMTEEQKIRHVTKGIREDAFQIFVVKKPATVSGIVDMCRDLQNARSSRIRLPSPSPLMTTSLDSLPPTISLDAIRDMIRDAVREEMDRRQFSSFQPQPTCNSAVQSIIRREVAAAMSTMPADPPPCAATLSHDRPCPRDLAYHEPITPVAPVAAVFSNPSSQLPYAPRGNTSEAPTCYFCGIRGHISRFCRKRQRELHFYNQRRRSPASPSRRNQYRDASQRTSYRDTGNDDLYDRSGHDSSHHTWRASRRRTPSPYPRRSSPHDSPGRFRSPDRPENR